MPAALLGPVGKLGEPPVLTGDPPAPVFPTLPEPALLLVAPEPALPPEPDELPQAIEPSTPANAAKQTKALMFGDASAG